MNDNIEKLALWAVKHTDFSDAVINDLTSIDTRPELKTRLEEVRIARQKLEALKRLPVIEQRTQAWYDIRKSLLTASDLGQSLGRGKFGTRNDLLNKKSGLVQDNFNGNIAPLKWGTMFEPVALDCYRNRNLDIPVHEFGLLPHPTLKVFGASPDGITETGVMVELKCPWRRKIEHDGEVPDQYMLQIQGQLEVTDLEDCDYVECKLAAYSDEEEYIANVGDDEKRVDHGIVLEYDGLQYDYSPPYLTCTEAIWWYENFVEKKTDNEPNKTLLKVHYWKLMEIQIIRVKRDKPLFLELQPAIVKFWEDVEKLRESGEPIVKAKRVKKETKPVFMFDDDE
jgi:putative phage-type endonuclease